MSGKTNLDPGRAVLIVNEAIERVSRVVVGTALIPMARRMSSDCSPFSGAPMPMVSTAEANRLTDDHARS